MLKYNSKWNFLVVTSCFLSFVAVAFIVNFINERADLIEVIALLIILLLDIAIFISLKRMKEKGDHTKVVSIAERAPTENSNTLFWSGAFMHVFGLPLSENVWCKIRYINHQIIIDSGASEFNLPIAKIISVSTTTAGKIQKQYVSSAGGAVAGGLLFGPIGAMIGGRVKEKTVSTATLYMIITYEKDGKPENIGFIANGAYSKVQKLIKALDGKLTQRQYEL